MIILKVPNSVVDPNPWQTRDQLDPGEIKILAMDIHQNDLLQPPMGRLVDQDGKPVGQEIAIRIKSWRDLSDRKLRIQLAFGHRRLAAFRWLGDRGWKDSHCYSHIDVMIRWLSDQQMANYAWAENEKRQDLTPLERARAIQARMDAFSWNATQAADQLGLARSTISNILRLLDLPGNIQAKVDQGEIPERSAQALAPLAGLPDDLIEKADQGSSYASVKEAIRLADEGAPSDQIRNQVAKVISYHTINLQDSIFPLDHKFDLDLYQDQSAEIHQASCVGCDKKIRRGKNTRCTDEGCYTIKSWIWAGLQLEKAAKDTGIQILDEDYASRDVEILGVDHSIIDELIQKKCEHLRLVHQNDHVGIIDLDRENHPGIKIVCHNRSAGKCTCISAKLEHQQEMAVHKKARKLAQIQKILYAAAQAVLDAQDAGIPGSWAILMDNKKKDYADLAFDQIRLLVIEGAIKDSTYRVGGVFWGEFDPKISKIRRGIQDVLDHFGIPRPDQLQDPENGNGHTPAEKLARIYRWASSLGEDIPTLDQVAGNLKNLEKLQAMEMDNLTGDDFDRITAQTLLANMQDLQQVLLHESWKSAGLAAARLGYIMRLVDEPVGDPSYRKTLADADELSLQYVLAIRSGWPEDGTRCGKIRAELLMRDQAMEMGGES